MPETLNMETTSHAPCPCLHSKEMFVQTEPDPGIPSMSSGIYWCIHTYNCLGPDGKVAEPGACKLGRRCFRLA